MKLNDSQGRSLARFARAVIARALGGPSPAPPIGSWVLEPAATFVTLHRGNALHGCIGSLTPRRPILEDVASNAIRAAFLDPRAAPLSRDGVAHLDVEVSVLSALQPIAFVDEASAIKALRPRVDGVVLRWRRHQGTFLPQVWEDLPDPGVFLAHLKRKAGLPADFWAPGITLHRYTLDKWIELAHGLAIPARAS